MMKFFNPKKVDLTKEGVARVLGELESKIIEYVWEHEQATAREILDSINSKAKDKVTFSTANTVINRMTKKGLLSKKKESSYYFYTPTVSREEFSKSVNQGVFNKLLKEGGMFSFSTFMDFLDSLPEKERKEISKMLKK